MLTTQQNDWSPCLNSVPWIQKARPGVRPTGAGNSQLLPASPPRRPSPPNHHIATGTTMSNDARKQRLLREAHQTEDGDATNIESVFVVVVVAVVAVVVYWGAAVLTVTSSAEQRAGTAPRESTMVNALRAAGVAAPQAETQNRPAGDKAKASQ